MHYSARLAASSEPDGTDHTGEIISFSDVGSGAGTDPPRPWVCYTAHCGCSPMGVHCNLKVECWQFRTKCSSEMFLILALLCIVVPHTSVLMENTAV